MKEIGLRSTLARSEAAATNLLARSMHDQGNDNAITEGCRAGLLVSLGPERYVNRLICTELQLSEDDVVRTVDFFTSRNMPSSIQISSLADFATIGLLRRLGFEVDWQQSVLAGPVVASSATPAPAGVTVGTVHADDLDGWLTVLAKGNGAESQQARATSDEFGRAAHGVAGAVDLLARVGGRLAACGSLQPVNGIGWLGGAATVLEFRRSGLQRFLLDVRIELASQAGHELVAATAVPGSSSMRNLERAGLTLVDSQTVWTRPN